MEFLAYCVVMGYLSEGCDAFTLCKLRHKKNDGRGPGNSNSSFGEREIVTEQKLQNSCHAG
jgi:hypothetical protein